MRRGKFSAEKISANKFSPKFFPAENFRLLTFGFHRFYGVFSSDFPIFAFFRKEFTRDPGVGEHYGGGVYTYFFDFPIFVCALYDSTGGAYEYPSIWLDHYRKTSEMTKNLDPEISDYTFFFNKNKLNKNTEAQIWHGSES